MSDSAKAPGLSGPGFFGKLPSHGDFINRRVSRGFLEHWDDWMQNAVASSKATLGDDWLDIYLTSPLWNFVLQPGICGKRGYAGVLMPSVDRVGRYFPLAIIVPVPGSLSSLQLASIGGEWFARAGDLAVSALQDEEFSLDDFDAAVEALGPVMNPDEDYTLKDISLQLPAEGGVCLPLNPQVGVAGSIGSMADGLVGAVWPSVSIWWSHGSEHVAPSMLACPGMPSIEAYTDFLDGQWRDEQWSFMDAVFAATEPAADSGAP